MGMPDSFNISKPGVELAYFTSTDLVGKTHSKTQTWSMDLAARLAAYCTIYDYTYVPLALPCYAATDTKQKLLFLTFHSSSVSGAHGHITEVNTLFPQPSG